MDFEWDENKQSANISKHGIKFTEAKTVFNDPLYIDFFDPDHSDNENRYIIFGISEQHRLLAVSYTERNSIIRIISARSATRSERESYEEH